MHKNFSFKGVVRSNDNILANEGECMELVNLRMVNGSLKPVPETVVKAVLPERYSKIYWHDKASCYICVKSDMPNRVSFYDSQWKHLLDDNGKNLDFPLLERVRHIEFLGYVVICITENGIRYLIFGDGKYRWLGECPPVPELSVGLSSKRFVITTDTSFSRSNVNTEISSVWAYNSRGYIDEGISNANKAGYYIDRALFRYALRLYDGSYIYSSHVIYVSDDNEIDGVRRDAGNLISLPLDASAAETRYQVLLLAFKPTFEFLNLDLENWKGVVVGIDVFTTGSIMGKKISTATTTLLDTDTKQYVTEKYEVYREKELDELWSDINNASLFYKIAEYNIDGKLLNAVDDVSQSNIVLQDSLSSFEQKALSTIVPDCSYMFNNRLHVASLREYFFKGYDKSALFTLCENTAIVEKMMLMTRIKTQNGVSEIVNTLHDVKLGYKNGTYQLPPLLMYPDSRAFEMRIFIVSGDGTYTKSFPLTSHKFLNQSQYLHKWYLGFEVSVEAVFASGKEAAGIAEEDVLEIFNEELGVHEVIYSSAKAGWTYKGADFPPEKYSSLRIFQIPRDVTNGDKLVFTIKTGASDTEFRDINNIPLDDTWQAVDDVAACCESNVYEERDNVIKVSMVDNPFVFPAKCTYSLSQGKVLALSTNKTPMSEGQFGEHPLYVFSKEGIQVLSVDISGTVAYSNMYPVSHEVCQNPDMVCGTDSGVLFLGAQGVMIIGGSKCLRLSAAMDCDGKELETIGRSAIFGKIASLYGLDKVVDTVRFLDFMRTAKAIRFPEMNEIMFCNEKSNYCFLYSMAANVWSKTSNRFVGFVNADGQNCMFCHNGDNTYIHIQGDLFLGKNKVMLVTRPYMFGTKLPKRIMQLMLHAYLTRSENSSTQEPFLSCFLLCSNDGVHYKLVSGCERSGETQDVVFPYFPTCSYRYYIFALTGELGAASMITALEIDVSQAWNNRLR